MSYHQTHHPIGLPACPLCGWKSLAVQQYGTEHHRMFYVRCEHCPETDDGGMIEGPRRDTIQEASQAFNTAMKKYSASFQEGRGGEY